MGDLHIAIYIAEP